MMEANRASSSSNEVRISALMVGSTDRRSRQTSTPLPSGSRPSRTATSGRRAGMRCPASTADPDSPTTSMSSSASSRSRSPRRTTSWSSSRYTRIMLCFYLIAGRYGGPEGPESDRPLRSGRADRVVRDDGDRATGVMEHSLTDRAEHQPGETAPPPGADDGELGAAGGLDQGPADPAVHEPPAQLDVGVLLAPAREGLLQYPGLLLFDVGHVVDEGEHVARTGRDGVGPGVYGGERTPAPGSLVEGEADRPIVLGRTVDAEEHVAGGLGPAARDQYGTGGVCGQLDRDRSDQQAGEPAEAGGADAEP